MSTILFIGEQEKGYFIEDIAKKRELQTDYIKSNGHIKYQTNTILEKSNVDYMVYDIDQYIDSAEEIVKEIDAVRKCNNAKAIIYASGYLPTSTIIVDLYTLGIKEFILSTNLTDMKDQLEKCMNGYYETNGMDEFEKIQSLIEVEEEIKEQNNFKMIGVAGAMNRIGTTTQALHIVKYLNLKGYKACYIHMNDTDCIEATRTWWVSDCEDEIGKLTLENVDHFYKVEKISDIKRLGYDYYVYDYGAYFNPNFNKVSFLEKDIKIFVIGIKPQEMPHSYQLIESAFYDDVKYIISFADEIEEDDIRDLMGDKAKDTIVPKRCTEPYKLFEPDVYKTIIPVESRIKEKENHKKKRGFLFRKKGSNHGKI